MKDSELIRKLHNGDKEAAGLMIERYYADIYRFCLYMVQSAVVKKLRIKIPHYSLLIKNPLRNRTSSKTFHAGACCFRGGFIS